MPYLVIENFSAGLDARRHPMMAPVGSLRRADNAFLTRGGELQKRRAFIPWQNLPVGMTKGLAVAQGLAYVFGSDAIPTSLPSAVRYQQLIHPDGVALQDILSWDVYDGKLYVVAQFVDGSIFHYYDGVRVTDWYDGRARCHFTVDAGHGPDIPTAGDPQSIVLSIVVDGIDVLAATVAWQGDTQATAQAIVDQINTFVSGPEYTASRNGNVVNIATSDPGSVANGRAVTIAVANDMLITPLNTVMAGGVDTTAYAPGTFVKTIQTKMYSVSGSLFHFSGVEQPTQWNDATGAGFINMANEDGQSQQLVAMERYYNKVAVFARHTIQIWSIDVDPALNAQSQTLRNTGLLAANSVEQFGDNDVFYLSDSGVRSLRARDSSTAAAVNDIGVPIDELIVARVAEIGPAAVSAACSVVDMGGRYWLVLGDRVYIFTQFPGSKVAGWTTFSPGMTIDDLVIMQGNLVTARSGDTIYHYGGDSGEQMDNTLCEIDLPLLFMEKPAHFKTFSAIDVIAEGHWRVYAGFEPLRLDAMELIAEIDAPTPSMQRFSLEGYGTHANIRLQSDDGKAARLSSFILHYELTDAG